MSPTLINQITGVEKCPKFLKIRNELWFLKRESTFIDVYDLNGKKRRSIQYGSIENIRSAAICVSKLAISAQNGLFIADLEGNIEYKVQGNSVCDMCVMGNLLYVLDNYTSTVNILKLDTEKMSHSVERVFALQNYTKQAFNTIQATADKIYIALRSADEIHQYDHNGIRMAVYTHCNTQFSERLNSPKLCGIDIEGSLLIARRYLGRSNIVLLTKEGQWHTIPIPGLNKPLNVCGENNTLWVYDLQFEVCKQYNFQ